ncbi:hypothetical protein T4E_9126 [Trichinella pseudospiralis]|uniref:Uncharacterized protein n=1 Tax=Trichinella pseudospiralis TaxID=6337 RepID=A0A0V0XVS3_TRIPS|nr:hypothetical protein T4E_9126 [Trichinella pseudospiralis]
MKIFTEEEAKRYEDFERLIKEKTRETQSESPLETGKEWEEKRAIQVLVQRKDPKEERYIVP